MLQTIAASRMRTECGGIRSRHPAPRTLLVLLTICALVCVTALAHGASTGPGVIVPPELITIVITATAVYGGGEASNAEVVLTVGIRPDASTLINAKSMPDGEIVSVVGLVVTSSVGDFADFFYIEEMNRTSGIRIAAPPSTVPGLSRRSIVNVIGTLATTANDERQISGPTVTIVRTAEPIGPLAMRMPGSEAGTRPDNRACASGGRCVRTASWPGSGSRARI